VQVPDDPRWKAECAVTLDGNKLQGEEAAAVLGIRVFQSRASASAFELIVSDPELKWQGKPTFTDCKEVKIELGVPGKLQKVFEGEVTAWRTELERSGPSVLVLRGLDRSHRLMRAKKTRTYADATPIDCAKQIASDHGLTAKTGASGPTPVKMFRFQANQTDFEFLRALAELEGYMFYIEGNELHFERPVISSTSDAEFSFGVDVKTFLPVANFRNPATAVEVGAWDVSGKSELTGKAKTGDELWTVPGDKPGATLAKFTSSKPEISLVESKVGTQEHADTVAKAALTRRAMEFITAEVEVQGNPKVRPGALVNIKKVGPFSGHYLVTEANHFYDAAGYNCVFYVARDKWGNSSVSEAEKKAAKEQQKQAKAASAAAAQAVQKPPEDVHLISVEVKAVGGTLLVNHPVQVIDPDSGKPVTPVLNTDAKGVLSTRVPEAKKYRIEILDDQSDHAPPPFAAAEQPAVLVCQFLDAEGGPLARQKLEARVGKETLELTTDDEGFIRAAVQLSPYELSILGHTFQAHGLPAADHDNPYVFVLKEEDDVHLIAVEVKSVGGTALPNQPVRIVDPDSGAVLSGTLTTDDEGVLRARVPEEKTYRIEVLDEEAEGPGAPLAPSDDAALLVCEFTDADGQALAGETVQARTGDQTLELTTDEEGRIQVSAHLAAYELEIRGHKFQAHGLPAADKDNPYRFLVAEERDVHVIAVEAKSVGDTALVNQPVRIVDPDTGVTVAETETDEAGMVRASVPEPKDYRIEIAEDESEETAPPPLQPEGEHAVLRCRFAGADGSPLAGEKVEARLGDHTVEATTDEDGRLEIAAELAAYELTVRGQKFQAHALPASDPDAEAGLYRFVVTGTES